MIRQRLRHRRAFGSRAWRQRPCSPEPVTQSGLESAAPVGNGVKRAGSVLVLPKAPGRALAPVVHRRLEKRCALSHTHHTADGDHFSISMISETVAERFRGWPAALDPLHPEE